MAGASANEIEFFKNDLIGLEEVRIWTTDAKKDCCRRRGCKVSGTQEELSFCHQMLSYSLSCPNDMCVHIYFLVIIAHAKLFRNLKLLPRYT